MLRVRLAGSLGLESDGREIPLPRSRRARGLLAYLAAHPGAHPRGELAGRFWPDVPEESARGSLRAALSELRRALGADVGVLVAGRDTVALEGVSVDLTGDGELLQGMDDEWVYELRRLHEPAVEVAPPAALSRPGVFVGRSAELERLSRAWAAVRADGVRRLVLVAGEPGVGKTRLSLRFAGAAAAEDGAAVLLGRCSEEPLAAFEPFTDILRHIGPAAARALAGPEVDRLLGGVGAGSDDAGARHRLFSAVDDVLGGLAARQPLVVVLDDLHWADRPTLLLLRFILRSARTAPLLVVGTYRDTDVGRSTPLVSLLPDLRRDGGGERVALRGLGVEEVAELAGAVLGPDAASRVAGPVHARTGGNAFFVEEVLRGLADDEGPVPESVRHAVGARLGRLSPAADDLLGRAAILGETFSLDLLEQGVEPLLDELFEAQLIRTGEGRRLEFTHALVREAVDAELNPLRRARLHREAADALIARGGSLEEIAHHLSEAADERAVEYLRRAGEHALVLLAYEEAAELFGRALEVEPGSGELWVARGDALLRAGEPDAARSCFDRAADLARELGDPVMLGRAALGWAGLGVTIIEVDEGAVERLEEALEVVAEPVLRSELLARLAVELYYASPRERSEALSVEAVGAARESGDARALAAALNARHVALWRPDRLEERLYTAEEMIEVGESQLELQARNWRIVDLFETMDMDEWRAEVRRHGELASRLRMPGYTWYTPLWAAVEAQLAGRFDEARDLNERAREEGRRAGDRNADLFAEMVRFNEVVFLGDWEMLNLDLLRDKIDNSPAGMAWRGSYTWMLAATGELDAAREQLLFLAFDDFARLPFDVNWQATMGECATVCGLLGDAELAGLVYDRLLPYAHRALTAGRAVSSYGSTERVLAGLAAAMGRLDEARARHETAIRRNEAAGFTVWAEIGRRDLAALHFDPAGR